MADNGFRPAPRKKIALDNPKLTMYAPNSVGKSARLAWGLVDNNPRITVHTNDPNDSNNDYGRISAHLDATTLYAIFELLKATIDAPGKCRDKIDCLKYTFPNGKRSDKPSVTASVVVGKDENGVIWISLSAYQRPQIQFKFSNPDFHHFIHEDGTRFTHNEVSVLYAKAYINLLERMYAHVLVTEFKEIERKPNGGGNGGGGYNRGGDGGGYKGGNSNGNYQKSQPKSDSGFGDDDGAGSDIPW